MIFPSLTRRFRGVVMSDFSTLLFARPSFVEGAARAYDIGNTLAEYNRSETGELADSYALSADWSQVWDDIRSALGASTCVEKIAKG
jgi:hypothetical protein